MEPGRPPIETNEHELVNRARSLSERCSAVPEVEAPEADKPLVEPKHLDLGPSVIEAVAPPRKRLGVAGGEVLPVEQIQP